MRPIYSHLETVNARELVAVPTLLLVVFLYRGLLQLFPAGVTGEVDHGSDIALVSLCKHKNCMNSSFNIRLKLRHIKQRCPAPP